MGHDLDAPTVGGLAHDHLDLLWGELGEVGMIRWAHDAACGANLNHVGPRSQHFTYRLEDPIHTIAAAIREPGIGRKQLELVARSHPAVRMPARDGQHRSADLHTRTHHDTRFDGLLHAHVGAPGIAHRGDARIEGPTHVLHGVVESQRERRRHHALEVEVLENQMHVRVDESGQDEPASRIDLAFQVIG